MNAFQLMAELQLCFGWNFTGGTDLKNVDYQRPTMYMYTDPAAGNSEVNHNNISTSTMVR